MAKATLVNGVFEASGQAEPYRPEFLRDPEPPGLILRISQLVPHAHDALPDDEFEQRIADYARRVAEGRPLPLFGEERPAEPPAPEPHSKKEIQCWACGAVAPRAGNVCVGGSPAHAGNRGAAPAVRWHGRDWSWSTVELYCPRCFEIWGWPDEFDTIRDAVNGVADILSEAGERLAGARPQERHEPAPPRAARSPAGGR